MVSYLWCYYIWNNFISSIVHATFARGKRPSWKSLSVFSKEWLRILLNPRMLCFKFGCREKHLLTYLPIKKQAHSQLCDRIQPKSLDQSANVCIVLSIVIKSGITCYLQFQVWIDPYVKGDGIQKWSIVGRWKGA